MVSIYSIHHAVNICDCVIGKVRQFLITCCFLLLHQRLLTFFQQLSVPFLLAHPPYIPFGCWVVADNLIYIFHSFCTNSCGNCGFALYIRSSSPWCRGDDLFVRDRVEFSICCNNDKLWRTADGLLLYVQYSLRHARLPEKVRPSPSSICQST